KPWTGYHVWKGYLEKDNLKDGCETADSRNCAVRDQRERLRVLSLKCCSVMVALRAAAGSCVATPLLRYSVGRKDHYQFFKPKVHKNPRVRKGRAEERGGPLVRAIGSALSAFR